MLNINNITQSCLVAVVAEKGKHTYKTDVGHVQFRSNIHGMSNVRLKGEATPFDMLKDLIMKKVCVSPRLSS